MCGCAVIWAGVGGALPAATASHQAVAWLSLSTDRLMPVGVDASSCRPTNAGSLANSACTDCPAWTPVSVQAAGPLQAPLQGVKR